MPFKDLEKKREYHKVYGKNYYRVVPRDKDRDRINAKARKRLNKEKAVVYLGGKCLRCGYSKCIAALDCHHVKPGSKDYTLTHLMASSWKKVEKELQKCILLCSNCHREEHYEG